MSGTLSANDVATAKTSLATSWKRICEWLCTWELYPMLVIATFLRLYRIDTTEFDDDQAVIFRMAHDAIVHGLLPATSNIASIRVYNPPAVVYLLMLPTALSANPFWGAVFVGVLNVVAVLLTYLFVRRYYGRLAGSIAGLLYATAVKPLFYSRFMWQQNMLAPFVMLFLFALFWGVVERRKDWLVPALLLLGVLYQLHETTAVLVVALLVAFVLVPGTIRWGDLALGAVGLSILFSTYLLWEISNDFVDVSRVFRVAKLPVQVDNTAFLYYRFYLSPYGLNPFEKPPTNAHLLVYTLIPMLTWVRRILLLLVLSGIVTAVWGVIYRSRTKSMLSEASTPRWLNWWVELRNSPYRCGLIVLLVWQLVPLLILLRHSVGLYPYYLLMLMPGPYMLIGLFLGRVVEGEIHLLARGAGRAEGQGRGTGRAEGQGRGTGRAEGRETGRPQGIAPTMDGRSELIRSMVGASPCGRLVACLRYGVYVLAGFLIMMQLAGSMAAVLDESSGRAGHGVTYNDLSSLQHAVSEADQLAQARRLHHVYIATDEYTQSALDYLAEYMHTPTTLFDASRCLVLPNPVDGRAVLLVGPDDGLTNALLKRFAAATLVDQPKRLGGAPFDLYIVKPLAEAEKISATDAFVHNLQLIDTRAYKLNYNYSHWLVTDWRLLRTELPRFRTTYSYILTASQNGDAGQSGKSFLNFSSLHAGDQLLIAFDLPSTGVAKHETLSTTLHVRAVFFIGYPDILFYGPLRLETFVTLHTPQMLLLTEAGKESIALSA